MSLEEAFYLVDAIDGDYAQLLLLDGPNGALADAEPCPVARFLLPPEADEGTRLVRHYFEYSLLP
ncbi:MAG: chorismate--pyruvate lyase [Oscillospiraceae bacterium]|nr:chorismate--pyruvate lyase [Oscillospiraceae bacterium]